MAAKAHEISLEAGSKMAAAMKDVVGAAAGLTGLVLESARDLLQYMVRRGQMTQDEADKLMREVEASHAKRKPFTPPASAAAKTAAPRAEASHSHSHSHSHSATAVKHHHPAPIKHAAKPAAKHAATRKPTAKKPTMKPAAKKHSHKSAKKSKPKASGKTAKRR
jgi:Mn-containing catalase